MRKLVGERRLVEHVALCLIFILSCEVDQVLPRLSTSSCTSFSKTNLQASKPDEKREKY